MVRQEDLRVTKTKRAIKETFLELLKQKDLNRITVTELASRAEINKGTFYLHYSDIYALYNEVLLDYIGHIAGMRQFYTKMLTEPKTFVKGFFTVPDDTKDNIGRYLLKTENIQYSQALLPTLINAVIKVVYESNPINQTEENNMKLRFLIGGMYAQAMFTDSVRNNILSEHFVEYLVNQIQSSFSDYYEHK